MVFGDTSDLNIYPPLAASNICLLLICLMVKIYLIHVYNSTKDIINYTIIKTVF